MFLTKLLNYMHKKSNFTFVLVDQAIVSMGNFILTVLILNFLGIKIFGLFSFLWLFLLLINSIQLSYIISPMITNAPKKDDSKVNLFYGGIFFQQLVFTITVSCLTYFVLKFFGNFISSFAISSYCLSFSIVIILSQLQQFLRRLLFSKKLYLRNIISDLFIYFFLISSIIYLNYFDKLNLEMVFWSLAISFGIGAIILFPIIFSLNFTFKSTYISIKENWIIGKWMLLTSIVQWFSGNLWIVNAGLILGPYMFGIFRACQTLVNIINLLFQSLENIIPRKVSKVFGSGSIKDMKVFLKEFATKGFFAVTIISFIIILFSKFLINFFYGTETAEYYKFMIYLSMILPITFLTFPYTYGLRAIGKTKPIFISTVLSSFFAILASKFVITNFHVYGLIVGIFFTQIIVLTSLYIGYLYYLKKMK